MLREPNETPHAIRYAMLFSKEIQKKEGRKNRRQTPNQSEPQPTHNLTEHSDPTAHP
jgi:hypothetical protein